MTNHKTPRLTLVDSPATEEPPKVEAASQPAIEQETKATPKATEVIADPVTDWESLISCRRVAITVEEVAGLLGLDRRTVYGAMDKGQIQAMKVGQKRLVNRLKFIAQWDPAA